MLRQLLTIAAFAGLAATANAQGQTGGLIASCNVMGQPATLQLQYEAIGGAGIIWGPGATPDIRGVVSDGSTTIYWGGTLSSAQGSLQLSGENNFLRFYDPNVFNRETVLRVDITGPQSFTLTDQFGNYPGSHPCQLTQAW